MTALLKYMADNSAQLIDLLIEHIELTFVAVGIAILVGVPLGILISYVKQLSKPIVGVANVIQAVPSMAMLGLAIPLLGIGVLPAIFMVTLYSLLPIIKNTYTGIASIDPEMVEAAKGIGLTRGQILAKVKIPMALPVIMAGVRISAVTAVGLMTMAAFIGAGGLGYMVFSGIRTANNLQILAGAIPACILALIVDFLMGVVERLVTPISLQSTYMSAKEKAKRGRRRQKLVLAFASVLLVVLMGNSVVASMGGESENKHITIGGMDFTEQFTLVYLYKDYIEHETDIKVTPETNLGGSQVCRGALKKGEIDMFVDYTGTIYVEVLQNEPNPDMQEVYEVCKDEMYKQNKFILLNQTGFNNTYTLATTKEISDKYKLTKLSDLKRVGSQLVSGTTLQFLNRQDCMGGLTDNYGITFKDSKGLDGTPRYTALENGEVDIIDAFGTDGLLKKFDLVVLKDDLNFFAPYYGVPVFREEVLKKYPELESVCNKLSSVLNDEIMMELNYRVDEKGEEPEDVARDFLESEGLI